MKIDYFSFKNSNSKIRSIKQLLLGLVMMLSVSWTYGQSTITIVTDSDYALWNLAISNPTNFLDWTATGPGINITETGTNTPTFDLSPNNLFGDVTILGTGTPADFAGITFLKADNGVGLRIKTIDVSELPNLERLDIDDNTIEDLDLSNNLNLMELNVDRNNLTSLDLSANTALTELYVNANIDLPSLVLSNNINLEVLKAQSLILISDIDISTNTKLRDVDLSNVPLTSVSIDAILNNLDSFGLSNGFLNLQNTSGGVITKDGIGAYVSLLIKNWTIFPPQGFDLGDAPDSYGTLLESGGAIHLNDPFHDELRIGNSKDYETNGFPGVDADGDDLDQFNDEDGVAQTELDGITTSSISWDVELSLTSNFAGISNLHAWIDFDGSGTFDADEWTTLAIAANSGQGTYTINWDITALGADIQEGKTYARFRFTKDGDLTASDPTGYATGGEVEDYTLVIDIDTDKDGVGDSSDLDDDNDGILDTVEEDGDINRDTDGDGFVDRIDLDSDGDGCFDVDENLYDNNGINEVGDQNPAVVDTVTGEVISLGANGGYGIPVDQDGNGTADFQEAGAAASITTDPVDQDFILAGSATFTATAVADTYQWEVSIDGGANWAPVANDANNAGADTNTLTVSNLTIDVYYNNTYRLEAEYVSFACDIIPAYSLAAGFNVLDDFDGDLVPDIVDLDDDNDGILDTVEENGDINRDTDGDGFVDRIDLDSDGDGCFDVDENLYDNNGINEVGDQNPPAVDTDGIVTSLGANGGYGIPVDQDGNGTADFQEAGAAASITTDPVDQDFILAGSATFTATAVADTYQWEVSIDGGANWAPVANDANNTGADTNTLTVSNLTIDVYYNNTYRLEAEYISFACDIIPAYSLAAGFNVLDDFDLDLVPDIVDLDDDNDGILDTVEENGDINRDTDGDGFVDRIDLDSDGDGCFDVDENLYDNNGINEVGDQNPALVDPVTGEVISLGPNGGYGIPVDADGNGTPDFQEAGAAPTITTQPTNQDLVIGVTTFSVVAAVDTYQWQEDRQDGNGFLNVIDNPGEYAGAQTADLQVTNTDFTKVRYQYQVIVTNLAYACDPTLISDIVTFVNPDDFDKDGVPDLVDQDDDNDGILDTVEEDGDINRDTDGDGFVDRIDLDSDGDGCFDVDENLYDNNGINEVGDQNPPVVDLVTGIVISLGANGGYGIPVDQDGNLTADFQEAGSAASITTNPVDQDFILAGSATFTATAVADTYQWELSVDGGANWTLVANDANNAGADTDALTVSNLTIDAYNDNTYRLVAEYVSFACDIIPAVSTAAGFNALDDFDGDTVPDVADLDDDNDGILDTVEEDGDINRDTDGDGFPDRIDLDADGDGCFDVDENLYENNGSNEIGTQDPPVVDLVTGIVTSLTAGDGYGIPEDQDINGIPDFQEAGAAAAITTQPEDQNFIPGDPATFTVVATADTYAWEESTDGGSNWNPVSGGNYSGVDTASLTILVTDISMINYEYRVMVNNIAYDCDPGTTSDAAALVSLPDNDNDGVPDLVDVDDDNDGIFDTDEQDALGADIDSNNNTIPDRFELDSDSDGCDDVTEAGFTDGDDDGLLGDSPVTVNPITGQVTSGTDGYITPNDLDNNGTYDFQETGTVASITSSPVDQDFVLGGSAIFTAASDGDTYQWEISADGVNFSPLTNDGKYSGTDTEILTVSGLVIPDYFNEYRVVARNIAFTCDPGDTSDSASYNTLIDTDMDGVFDIVDIDDDNDGIYDTVEGEFTDSNLDGDPDRISLDSDSDSCADVIEAGFTDPDGDGILGSSPVDVDVDGQVIGQGGYSTPNDLDNNGTFDFQEEGSASDIENQPEDDEIALGEDALFEVDGNATFYQWQESTDGGNTWFDLSNDDKYSGVDSDRLRISEARGRLEGNMYRVVLTSPDFACDPVTELISAGVRLIFNTTIIPDGFSPNGDGINDLFSIPGLIETPDFTMEVFDRWGNSVYKYANNGNLSPDWWDGLSTGNMTLSKGQLVPAGTYFYLIEYNDGNNSPDKGYVYINY